MVAAFVVSVSSNAPPGSILLVSVVEVAIVDPIVVVEGSWTDLVAVTRGLLVRDLLQCGGSWLVTYSGILTDLTALTTLVPLALCLSVASLAILFTLIAFH